MSSLIGHTLADPPHVCWKRGENKREVQGTGVGTVLGKPALPPFGQFSVCVKWSLKEAAELELSCRSPTQRGKSLLGGGHSVGARKIRRDQAQACATHATGPCHTRRAWGRQKGVQTQPRCPLVGAEFSLRAEL